MYGTAPTVAETRRFFPAPPVFPLPDGRHPPNS